MKRSTLLKAAVMAVAAITIYIMYAGHVSYHAALTVITVLTSCVRPLMRLCAFTRNVYVPCGNLVYSLYGALTGLLHSLS